MMKSDNITKTYIDGLKKAYINSGAKEQWDEFEKVVCGASDEDMIS